jgi:AraC-like DNA-binding protein
MISVGETVRMESERGFLELVPRLPHPLLRPYVWGPYEGFVQAMRAPVRRLEVPNARIVLIIGFGPSIRVDGVSHGSFVAGLYDRPVVVADDGRQACIQVDLTPLGARVLLGLPMKELTRRTVALDDVLRSDLPERLASLAGWPERFAAVDEFLLQRLREARMARPDVVYALSRMEQTGGRIPVAELCRELRCSGRHLSARFGEEVGLPPKAFARVLRFERAVAMLKAGAPPAEVAMACGFADQPHLNRDFRALAGRPPGAFAAAVANVQDEPGLAA